MENINKVFKLIHWILTSIFVIITAIALTVMFDIATETGGAPGYKPKAIFTSWLFIAAFSASILIFLVYLNSIVNFVRKKITKTPKS